MRAARRAPPPGVPRGVGSVFACCDSGCAGFALRLAGRRNVGAPGACGARGVGVEASCEPKRLDEV